MEKEKEKEKKRPVHEEKNLEIELTSSPQSFSFEIWVKSALQELSVQAGVKPVSTKVENINVFLAKGKHSMNNTPPYKSTFTDDMIEGDNASERH